MDLEMQNYCGEWTVPGKGGNNDCSSIDICITPQPGEIEIRSSPECTCKEEEAGYCEKDEQEEWVVQEVEEYVIKCFQDNVEEVEKAVRNSFHSTFGRALHGNSAKVTVGFDMAMKISVEREPVMPDSSWSRELSTIECVPCSPGDSDESEDDSQCPVLVEEEADEACPWREGPITDEEEMLQAKYEELRRKKKQLQDLTKSKQEPEHQGPIGIAPSIPETEGERYESRLKRLLRKPSMKWTTKIEPGLKEFLRNPDGKLSSYFEEVMQKEDCTDGKGEPGS